MPGPVRPTRGPRPLRRRRQKFDLTQHRLRCEFSWDPFHCPDAARRVRGWAAGTLARCLPPRLQAGCASLGVTHAGLPESPVLGLPASPVRPAWHHGSRAPCRDGGCFTTLFLLLPAGSRAGAGFGCGSAWTSSLSSALASTSSAARFSLWSLQQPRKASGFSQFYARRALPRTCQRTSSVLACVYPCPPSWREEPVISAGMEFLLSVKISTSGRHRTRSPTSVTGGTSSACCPPPGVSGYGVPSAGRALTAGSSSPDCACGANVSPGQLPDLRYLCWIYYPGVNSRASTAGAWGRAGHPQNTTQLSSLLGGWEAARAVAVWISALGISPPDMAG